MARETVAQQPTLSFTPPTNESQLIEWLNHKIDLGKPATTEAQMKLNLAFVLGYQWVTWDQRIRAYVRPRVDVNDPNAPIRLTANKIAPAGERLVAKLTKSAPEPEARPVTDNDDDVSAAKVATRIAGSELNRLQWQSWLQQFLFSPWTTGFAYAHVRWDPSSGDKVDLPESANSEDGDDDALFVGNVALDIIPAFELSVDPAGHNMEEAKWAVRTTTMTREAAWERWGVTLQGGGRRSLAMEVMALGNNADARPMGQDWVQVHQFWQVPSRAAPRGLVVTWSEQEIIEKKDFPYDHGKLPFVQMNWLPPLENMREGRTPVVDMIPLQVDYNDSLSREATIRRQLTPKLLAPAGSIDPARITSRVETLVYNNVGKPEWIEPNAAWVQQFETGMERDAADMADRAGMNDASSGQSSSSAPAAAILALQEADDTKLAVTATELASFVQNVGWQILMLCRQYWAEERTARVWSDEDILEAYQYMGSDIDEQLDVHVSSESALPKSKSARAQLILELAARYPQLIQPQDVVRMLDVPGVDFLTRSIDVDTRKQYRENSQMLTGNPNVKVQPYDNHAVHLQVLNNFRKTSAFENLPRDQQLVFDAHAAVHEMLVLKQLGIAVPTPNPTMDPNAAAQAQQASAGPAAGMPSPTIGATSPYLLDPMTGMPQDPMAVASGQAPDMLANTAVAKRAGIGQAAGQPGRVPGIPVDNQAASMGH